MANSNRVSSLYAAEAVLATVSSGAMTKTIMNDQDLLSRLVAFDTTSELSNRPIMDFLCDYLDRPGLTTRRFEASEGKENLVVHSGSLDGSGDGMTLSGHLDCVPVGSGWTTDPHELHERDGRLFARGSCDMKGFDALAVNAMAREAQSSDGHPLALVLTCDEELGSLGAASLVEQWPSDLVLPRSTIIGEPTMLEVVRMHKGHLKFTIRLSGASGHSGTPTSGINAIEMAGKAIGVLGDLISSFEDIRTEASPIFDSVPHPVLSIVGIDGGAAWNIIPEASEIRCGLRVMPDQDAAEYLGMIREALSSSLPEGRWVLEVYNDNPPMCTDEDTAVNRLACDAIEQSRSIGVSYCSDGGHLSSLGLESVLWGPGSITQAHQPDEFIAMDQFLKGSGHLAEAVQAHCHQEARA
ncbi:MAG: M20 family metallopeptidase [Phycisphaerales bacterium]|nr:M20 family metallopeptidase [Phycisphaerales bacterium]